MPKSGQWVEISQDRLIKLQHWLIHNCYVLLGDRVWKQGTGIPMGFSCSPIWCNIYLLSYEVRFIQRLAALGRVDIMAKFLHAFRYIDDICWINVGNPHVFLSPDEPRIASNPY